MLVNKLLDKSDLIKELESWGVLSAVEVRERWGNEEKKTGFNVMADAAQFGVTPHIYNESMEHLYKNGLGFIFETLCYWIRQDRQGWTQRAIRRLNDYCQRNNIPRDSLKILMLGDGAASDTLMLIGSGYAPVYFDVPGSLTSEFSRHRFVVHDVQDKVSFVENYQALLRNEFDALWCFDVLEHIPDLPRSILEMSSMLRTGGIALITESCRYVLPHLPTHLLINKKYHGKIPSIMQKHGLYLMGFERGTDFRPCEYVKLKPGINLEKIYSHALIYYAQFKTR